jgi:hypothetical protein
MAPGDAPDGGEAFDSGAPGKDAGPATGPVTDGGASVDGGSASPDAGSFRDGGSHGLGDGGSCAAGLPCVAGWYEIPNTSLMNLCPVYSDIQGDDGCTAVVTAWGSAAVDTQRDCMVVHGGGHVDYSGNEIYSLCFDTTLNVVTTGIVRDASHGSGVDTAIAACAEAFPDGTPNSRHDYNGFLYLPATDEYFLYGGGLSTCGNFSDGNWVYSPGADTWTQLAPSAHPDTAENGSIPASAFDPMSGCLYMEEVNVGNFWQYCRGAATQPWTLLTGTLGSSEPCQSDDFSAIIDPAHGLYVCAGDGALGSVNLAAPYAPTDDSAAPGCATGAASAISQGAPGIAYDPVGQRVILWAGGDSVLAYDPSLHACTTLTFTGGPGAQASAGTFERFAYMPSLGGFLLVNGMDQNAYFLRVDSP